MLLLTFQVGNSTLSVNPNSSLASLISFFEGGGKSLGESSGKCKEADSTRDIGTHLPSKV